MMAVLGVQFVITMMMATILSRVGPHLSIARWLLCSRSGLYNYRREKQYLATWNFYACTMHRTSFLLLAQQTQHRQK